MSYSRRLRELGAGVNCAHSCSIDSKARVAKLADAPDLGSGGEILRGSSPLPGTLVLSSSLGGLSPLSLRQIAVVSPVGLKSNI
jgi:hypothetical protein